MTKIAIIGVSFEFPGVKSLDKFWQSLLNGECLYNTPKPDILGSNSPNQYIDAWGGVEQQEAFDNSFFDYTFKEASYMDPQHRHLLKHSYWALENSGYVNRVEQHTIGIFASASINRYLHEQLASTLVSDSEDEIVLGNILDFLATRVAYKLGLTGPALTVQSGCSSALVNLHQARIALLTNQCDIALSAAVSFSAPQQSGYYYQADGIRSHTGKIRPFDKDATGTVFTNGVAVLVLKKLEAAISDRDSILGVISSSAINNDGYYKASFTAPSSTQQRRVIEKAFRISKESLNSLCLIETHGTGTALGDPIEFDAIKNAYPITQPCVLQSVKANVGHMDTVSGFAGIIKGLLVLKHRTLPPQVNYDEPNPRLNLEETAFYVNKEQIALPAEGPLCVGVSALGIGGTNAHVILSSFDESAGNQQDKTELSPPVILCSAKDPVSLNLQVQSMAEFCQTGIDLLAIAATTQLYRPEYAYRYALYAASPDSCMRFAESAQHNVYKSCAEKPAVAFLFPGQGSQYLNMGMDLYARCALFKKRLENRFNIIYRETGINYLSWVFADNQHVDFYQTQHAQLILLAFEVAMADFIMHDIGIMPTVLIGHSLGEWSALVVSSAVDFEQAVRIVMKRARLMQQTPEGLMLAVFATINEITPLLEIGVSIAAINAPKLLTLAGEASALDVVKSRFDASSIRYAELPIDKGFHSHLMQSILSEFEDCVRQVKFSTPKIPIISNITGDLHTVETLTSPTYWSQQIRQAVQFKKGIETIEANFKPIYCEVGPGVTLTNFVKSILQAQNKPAINFLPPKQLVHDTYRSFFIALMTLWEHGFSLHWKIFNNNKIAPIALPPYVFHEKRCWIDRTGAISSNHDGTTSLMAYQKVWQQHPEVRSMSYNGPVLILHNGSFPDDMRSVLLRYFTAEMLSVYDAPVCDDRAVFDLLISLEAAHQKPVLLFNLYGENQYSLDWQAFCNTHIAFLNALAQRVESSHGERRILAKHIMVATSSNDFLTEVRPEQAILPSLVKTINQEKPAFKSLLVDLTKHHYVSGINILLQNLNYWVESSKPIVVIRGESCFTEHFVPMQALEPSGVKDKARHIVVIGGAGSVGRQYIQALNEQDQQTKFTLIQRRSREQILSSLGPQSCILAYDALGLLNFEIGDIGDLSTMRAALENSIARFGPIDMLIHTAGIDASLHYRLMNDIDNDFVQNCFYAKRIGLQNVASLATDYEINNVHIISSISSVLAGIGMYIYSALHAYIDAFVAQQNLLQINRLKAIKWSTINWEAWDFNNQDIEPELFRQGAFGSNLDDLAMSPETGRVFIQNWLNDMPQHLVVSNGCLQQRYLQWVEQGFSNNKAVIIKDARPLLATDYVAASTPIMTIISGLWSDLLGIEHVGIHDNFFELGGHSLLALQLTNQLTKIFNKSVSIVNLFAYPTIEKLAQYFEPTQRVDVDSYNLLHRAQQRQRHIANSKHKRIFSSEDLHDTK